MVEDLHKRLAQAILRRTLSFWLRGIVAGTGVALLLVVCVAPVFAAQGKVVLEVSRNQIAVGDWIQATVRFQDVDSGTFTGLQVPPGLEVVGQSQSSSYRMVNGASFTEKAFIYDMIAQKTGELILGPVAVTIDGQKYQSERVTLTVSASGSPNASRSSGGATKAPGSAGQGGAPGGAGSVASSASTSSVDEPPFRLSAALSSPRVFVGELLTLTLSLSHREGPVQVQYRELKVPDLPGMSVEDVSKPRSESVVENGVRMAKVTIIRKLTPLKPGDFRIENVTAVADVLTPTSDRDQGGFFGSLMPQYARQTRAVTADPLTLSVLPLPEAGRPSDFSGLVGETTWALSYEAENLGNKEVRVGDSFALTIRVTSTGDLSGVKLSPPVPDALLKVYEDAPKIETERRDTQTLQVKEFRYAVVASRAGAAQLGPVKLSFFSPKSGQYEVLERAFDSLMISASAAGTGLETGKGLSRGAKELSGTGDGGQVQQLAQDLMPLKSRPEHFADGDVRRSLLFKIGLPPVVSLLAYLLVLLGLRHRERLPLISRIRRRRSALSVALARLSDALRQVKDLSGDRTKQAEFAKSVLGIVRDYLAARTGMTTSQKTSSELQELFGDSQNAPPGVEPQELIWTCLGTLEGLVFSNVVLNPAELEQMVETVKSGLQGLDRRL